MVLLLDNNESSTGTVVGIMDSCENCELETVGVADIGCDIWFLDGRFVCDDIMFEDIDVALIILGSSEKKVAKCHILSVFCVRFDVVIAGVRSRFGTR